MTIIRVGGWFLPTEIEVVVARRLAIFGVTHSMCEVGRRKLSRQRISFAPAFSRSSRGRPNVLTLSCKKPPAVRGSLRRGGRRDGTSIGGSDVRPPCRRALRAVRGGSAAGPAARRLFVSLWGQLGGLALGGAAGWGGD